MEIATRGPGHGPGSNGSAVGTRWHPPRISATRHARPDASRPAVRRRPRLPLATLGIALVLGGALLFSLVTMHTASGEEVLTVLRPLPAGSVLSASDLGSVRLTGANALAPIPATAEARVIGRSVAVPVVAGSLLAPGELGSSSPLTTGTEEVALALRAGQYPPDLAPGARVDVVPVPASTGTMGASLPTSPIAATVLAVSSPPSGATANAIVSLVVPATSADAVLALDALGAANLAELPSRAATSTVGSGS